MRKVIFAILAVTTAAGATGTVINSFAISELGGYPPRGLAYDAATDSYWVTANFGARGVHAYRFIYDGFSAIVEESFAIPEELFWSMDIAAGEYLYVNSDFNPDHPAGEGAHFYHIDKTTGAIVGSATGYEGPYGAEERLNGASFDGSNLYLSSYDSNIIHKAQPDGTEISSFAHGYDRNVALAWGGVNAADEGLWVVSGPPHNVVTKYKNGSQVGQWFIDLDNQYIAGACWGLMANESILVSTYGGSNLVYEISFAAAAIEGASVGRIKAVFK